MRTVRGVAALPLLLLATAALADTATFRQGASGYTGVVDTWVQQDPANINTNNGASTTLGWDGDNPANSGNDEYVLIRFDNIIGTNPGQIPPGATINSATLQYTVWDTGDPGQVHEILVPWTAASTFSTFCGASCDEGSEFGPTIGSAPATALGTGSADVRTSVQAWANGGVNRGWLVFPTGPGGVDVRSSEYATLAERPILTVVYNQGSVAAGLVRQPYLQKGTPNSMTLVWRTDAASDSRVRYGTTAGNLTQSATSATVSVDHIVAISGLSPATRYYYDIGSTTAVQGGGTAEHYFETSPTAGVATPFRAWVLGDSGTGTAIQLSVRNAFQTYTAANPADLMLHVGDIAYDGGTDSEFTTRHFGVYKDILRHTVSWPTLGNHEGTSTISGAPGASSGPYYSAFVLPTAGEAGGEPSGTEAYYSFDYANVHFICLNSTQVSRAANGPMAQWLTADLAATNQQWIVAFWHHPPYSHGTHNSDSDIELVQMRENIMPILEAGGVDLVLSGHSHDYERSYLINGTYSTPTPPFATLLGQGKIVDDGDGRPTGDGPYLKSPGRNAHEGEVVVVAGHGGSTTGGSLNHPVMVHSESANGSVVLDIDATSITGSNLRYDGAITDTFRIVKGDLPPRVTQAAPPKDDVLASLGSITVTFSTAVTGVDASDLTVGGSPATTLNVVTPAQYTFGGFAATGQGTVQVTLATGGIADASNATLHFAGDTWHYVIDTTPPVVNATQPDRGARTSLLDTIAVTFSKPVVNVSPDDLLVNGQPATVVSGISGTTGPYTFSGYPDPAPGAVTVTLQADGIHDTQTPAHAFAGDSWAYARERGLVINEFLASNNTTITDENGEFDDYVEIYNPGSEAADMGGMFLTDQLGFPTQYRIPAGVSIPAGGHLVFWCDSQPQQGPLHTNFNLSRTGEDIGLFAGESDEIQAIDTLTFPTQTTDVASGRFPDGASGPFVSMPATPSAANTISCSSSSQCTALSGPCSAGVCTGGRCVSQAANEGASCSTGVACLTGETCGGGVCDGGTSTCAAGQTCDVVLGTCFVPAAPSLPINIGATWSYLPGTAEPNAAWNTLNFDASSWTTGASGFGYGPDCTAQRGTTLATMMGNYVSLYARRTFSVANPALVTSLTLTVDYDDAFVAYLNGTEVARSTSMGGTVGVPPAYNLTLGSTNHECSNGSPANPAETYDLTPFINLLQAGNNVLAIHGHNTSLTSTDFVLDPALTSTQAAGCATSADCNDSNPCTDDICNTGVGMCTHTVDNTNLCSDGVTCTNDVCSNGACLSVSNCAGGLQCNVSTGACEVPSSSATFQDGVAGYTATVDTYVQAGTPDANNGLATTLIVDGPPPATDERQILLRFDNLFESEGGPIPDGSAIVSASLTLHITNPSADGAAFHRLLIPWSEAASWNTLTAGVQHDGTDAVATPDVSSLYNGTVPASHVIDVTSSVAAWSAGAINHGWVLVTPGAGADSWQFDSSEGATVADRPKLSIVYATGGNCTTSAECDDGNLCNGVESCSGGLCQPGTVLVCNDGNACTTDSCSPGSGCVFTNNTNACNDGNACTTGDVCSGGLCGGVPLSCNDGVACTTDSCNVVSGCQHADSCPGGTTCNAPTGVCQAAPVDVTFRDGVAGYTGTIDTFVHAGAPTTNNALATTLIVDGPATVPPTPADERQILLRFDSLFAAQGGPIPDGATIVSASLTLNITNPSADGAHLHRMIRTWSDTDTWNSLTAGVSLDGVEAVASSDVNSLYNGTVPAVHVIDVTSSVAAWAAGGANRGWVLVTPSTGSDSWQFDSSEATTVANRPQLSVRYQAFAGPRGQVECSLSAPSATPGSSVSLETKLRNLGLLPAVRGYQTRIVITRTQGTGTLDVACPGGVSVNQGRPDWLFAGQAATFTAADCANLRATSSLASGGVTVGASPAYLSSYALTVSPSSAAGSQFQITLAAYPETALADAQSTPLDFVAGTACTLDVTGQCSTNAQCDDGDPCTTDLCSAAVCQHAPSGACGVQGAVRYYRDAGAEPSAKPVGTVGVDRTGDTTPETSTDAAGSYALGSLAGNVTVATTPKLGSPRAADHNGAITSFDASLVAQASVLQITLSPNQAIAADVTGNGQVTSFDAARISQFAIQTIDHFDVATAAGSDWRFLRCDTYTDATNQNCGAPSYTHAPLTGTPTDNFYAVLYGDVSGNWSPAAPLQAPSGLEAAAASRDAERAQAWYGVKRVTAPPRRDGPARLTLDGWANTLAPGARRQVLVTLTGAEGIEGLDLSLRFDPSRLRIVAVEPVGIGADLAVSQHVENGTLRIAAYGAAPLAGSGAVVAVTVEATTKLGARAPFEVQAQANEGAIPVDISGTSPAGRPERPRGRPDRR